MKPRMVLLWWPLVAPFVRLWEIKAKMKYIDIYIFIFYIVLLYTFSYTVTVLLLLFFFKFLILFSIAFLLYFNVLSFIVCCPSIPSFREEETKYKFHCNEIDNTIHNEYNKDNLTEINAINWICRTFVKRV